MAVLPPPPAVSQTTMHMCGLLVDVYGLSSPPKSASVSLLWLHHPRLRSKEDMADIAARCVAAADARGHCLVALAFDQRNHGSRLVDARANGAWREGNKTHAQDMWGVINGTVLDTQGLMDVVEAYLFPDGRARVAQHLFLGVSLGGHSGWQLMFSDARVRAAVLVIGCPDYLRKCLDCEIICF
jgi:hypothetical protein